MSQVIPTIDVSTHSRPKAAGRIRTDGGGAIMFQHTAARRRLGIYRLFCKHLKQFQHTAARRRLVLPSLKLNIIIAAFQHTAARRRLESDLEFEGYKWDVSTHSRPKAAGTSIFVLCIVAYMFQHTAARRRLGYQLGPDNVEYGVSTHSRPKAAGNMQTLLDDLLDEFQHTAARRRLENRETIVNLI